MNYLTWVEISLGAALFLYVLSELVAKPLLNELIAIRKILESQLPGAREDLKQIKYWIGERRSID